MRIITAIFIAASAAITISGKSSSYQVSEFYVALAEKHAWPLPRMAILFDEWAPDSRQLWNTNYELYLNRRKNAAERIARMLNGLMKTNDYYWTEMGYDSNSRSGSSLTVSTFDWLEFSCSDQALSHHQLMFMWHKDEPRISAVAIFVLGLEQIIPQLADQSQRLRCEEVVRAISNMQLGKFNEQDRIAVRDFLRDIKPEVSRYAESAN